MNKQMEEKEKKFAKLKKKLKIFDTIDAYSFVYPIVTSCLIGGLFFNVSLIAGGVFLGLGLLDGALSFFKKGLTSFLTNKKYQKVEDEYYKLGEELAYFIQDEDGMYYNREYLNSRYKATKNKKYLYLLHKLVQKQTFKNPVGELMKEIEEKNYSKKTYGYSISTRDRSMFEIKSKEQIAKEKKEQQERAKHQPIDEKDLDSNNGNNLSI